MFIYYLWTNINNNNITVKPAHTVTSIKQSPVVKGHHFEKVVVTGQENRGMFDCKGYQIRKALIIISVGFVSLMFLQNRIW
jgi:hypothetical protein